MIKAIFMEWCAGGEKIVMKSAQKIKSIIIKYPEFNVS
jgi:hypothetical protein